MKIKATTSFVGEISMAKNEIRDVHEGVVLSDLLKCGYVVPVEEKAVKRPSKKAVKTDEAE